MHLRTRRLDSRDFYCMGRPAALVTEPDTGTPYPRRLVFGITSPDDGYWRDEWLHAVEHGWSFGEEAVF